MPKSASVIVPLVVVTVNSMKSMDGRINIKGFYDDIVDPGEEEKEAARELA